MKKDEEIEKTKFRYPSLGMIPLYPNLNNLSTRSGRVRRWRRTVYGVKTGGGLPSPSPAPASLVLA